MFTRNRHTQTRGENSRQSPEVSAASSTIAISDDEHSPTWQRFRFTQCWFWLQLPVVVVILASVMLFIAVLWTDNASVLLAKLFEELTPQGEANIPSWINAGLWLIAALVAGYISLHVREHRSSWTAVSALSFGFSLDETISVHERLDGHLSALETLLPIGSYVWILPGAAFTLMVAVLLLRMVQSLPRTSRNGFFVGGIVFVSGSLVMECFEALVYFEHGVDSAYFVASGMIEESCEMTGVALAIAAMIHLIEWQRLDRGTAYRVNTRRESTASRLG